MPAGMHMEDPSRSRSLPWSSITGHPCSGRDGGAGAPQAIELRHLRYLGYLVALADAGSFTHAAERVFVAQPTPAVRDAYRETGDRQMKSQ